MKVFISWSGELSKEVAIAFREWLPSVIQVIEPYVSSEDIRKGNRWSSDISRELEVSSFGIVMLTPDNLDAPWINFEAGALTKTVERSFVSPLLFGVKNSDLKGPLTQFQTTDFEKEEIKKLIISMNKSLGEGALEEGRLGIVFEKWWPDLEEKLLPLLANVKEKQPVTKKKTETNAGEILEELLKLTRSQQQLLNDPERLFPIEYMNLILKRGRIGPPVPIPFVNDLQRLKESLAFSIDTLIEELPDENKDRAYELAKQIQELDSFIHFLKRRKIGLKYEE